MDKINNLLMLVIYKGDSNYNYTEIGYTKEQKDFLNSKMEQNRDELSRFAEASVKTLKYKLEESSSCDLFDLLFNKETMKVLPNKDDTDFNKLKHTLTYYIALFDSYLHSGYYDKMSKTNTRLFTIPIVLTNELYNIAKKVQSNPKSKEYKVFADYFYSNRNADYDLTIFVSSK